ncbi:metal-binding protein [Leptobacterium flavescens]|uniref:Metal-binding protein n=1 Tax=Leptobacterium flavescens TaxID=472055 RepID=A0A6P0UK41_9FLAO|nr:metal-binding protein [Leptobacterium flavescens]
MIDHNDLSAAELRQLIRNGHILLGGNKKLKIYGNLHCKSGKRMKTANRVFFSSVAEARKQGYRPCGHCMRDAYKEWKVNRVLRPASPRNLTESPDRK